MEKLIQLVCSDYRLAPTFLWVFYFLKFVATGHSLTSLYSVSYLSFRMNIIGKVLGSFYKLQILIGPYHI